MLQKYLSSKPNPLVPLGSWFINLKFNPGWIYIHYTYVSKSYVTVVMTFPCCEIFSLAFPL